MVGAVHLTADESPNGFDIKFMTLNKTIMGAQLQKKGMELEPCFAGFALMQAAIYSRSGKDHKHVADVLTGTPGKPNPNPNPLDLNLNLNLILNHDPKPKPRP